MLLDELFEEAKRVTLPNSLRDKNSNDNGNKGSNNKSGEYTGTNNLINHHTHPTNQKVDFYLPT